MEDIVEVVEATMPLDDGGEVERTAATLAGDPQYAAWKELHLRHWDPLSMPVEYLWYLMNFQEETGGHLVFDFNARWRLSKNPYFPVDKGDTMVIGEELAAIVDRVTLVDYIGVVSEVLDAANAGAA